MLLLLFTVETSRYVRKPPSQLRYYLLLVGQQFSRSFAALALETAAIPEPFTGRRQRTLLSQGAYKRKRRRATSGKLRVSFADEVHDHFSVEAVSSGTQLTCRRDERRGNWQTASKDGNVQPHPGSDFAQRRL